MLADDRPLRLPRVSARLRLALSYAVFLVAAGIMTLVGVYVVLRYIPDYPREVATGYEGAIYSRQEVLDALSRVSGIILLMLAVIGGSGGWVLAGWVLRPLQRINEAARIAATGRLDHRIRLTGRNDEFRQLADTFDHMLDRLHDAFSTQERFAANASHELRTPLAVNAALLDVARLYPDGQDYPTLIERLSTTNTRAIGLTEALLHLADANSITAMAEPVDLAQIVRAAIADAATEAERHRVQIDAHLEFAATSGDASLLEQLAINLIQNAIRHNHSPGDVSITTYCDLQRATVTLRVENTGDHYTPEQVAQFREPFLRGKGRINVPNQARGYGLGLALVSQITTVHDGTLALTPASGGGLIVTVMLPAGRSSDTRMRAGESGSGAQGPSMAR